MADGTIHWKVYVSGLLNKPPRLSVRPEWVHKESGVREPVLEISLGAIPAMAGRRMLSFLSLDQKGRYATLVDTLL